MVAHPFLPTAARRSAALAGVISAHLLVLLLLLVSPSARRIVPAQSREPALLWTFIRPGLRQGTGSSVPQLPGSALRAQRLSQPRVPPATDQILPAPAANPARIDWAQQARSTAISEVAREETERRHADARSPPRTALFSDHPPGAKFAWSHAATHRIESLRHGAVAINLTDECGLIFTGLMLIPACALEKVPARGDLFDHMHDAAEFDEHENAAVAQESRASH